MTSRAQLSWTGVPGVTGSGSATRPPLQGLSSIDSLVVTETILLTTEAPLLALHGRHNVCFSVRDTLSTHKNLRDCVCVCVCDVREG